MREKHEKRIIPKLDKKMCLLHYAYFFFSRVTLLQTPNKMRHDYSHPFIYNIYTFYGDHFVAVEVYYELIKFENKR